MLGAAVAFLAIGGQMLTLLPGAPARAEAPSSNSAPPSDHVAVAGTRPVRQAFDELTPTGEPPAQPVPSSTPLQISSQPPAPAPDSTPPSTSNSVPSRTPGPSSATATSPRPTPTPSRSSTAATPTIDVYPGQNVSAIVRSAPSGERILLHAGTYGPIGVYRSNIWIDGQAGVHVSGGASRVLEVRGASNVTITNLTIQNAPNRWGAGLWVERSSGVSLRSLTLRDNHSFGLKVIASQNVTARNLDIYGNDTGTDSSGDLSGFELTDSRIHDQKTMVVDGSGGARGANATNFYHATGPILVARNLIWNNRAASATYGHDGGAFEVYGSSGITYSANVVWDSQNVMEMGTDTVANAGITFVRNVLYKPAVSTAAVKGPSEGILIRACHGCLFANNTLVNLDNWSLLVVTGNFTNGIGNSGVRFANNIVRQSRGKAIELSGSGVTVDHDLFYLTGGSLGMPLDPTSRVANPMFADGQYRVAAGSPAINRGAVIAGVTTGYRGSAPDIGRWE